MKNFTHIDAKTVSEAASALGTTGAVIIAGGTDLIGRLKDGVLPNYPTTLVNIKTIPNMNYIKEEGGMLKIGALALLSDIAVNATVKGNYAVLAQAAGKAATPKIRDMGTIGGNICQLPRCWYFRNLNNRFNCIRKGGTTCFAAAGENQYHSIFGAVGGCVAVNPSDTAPALVALNASIVTNKKTYTAETFWDFQVAGATVMAVGEIVTEIQIPTPAAGSKSAFIKFAVRKSIDFPIVNSAAAVSGGTFRVCLNAVYNKPFRATAAEDAMKGQAISDATAAAAATAAVKLAAALGNNKYKIQIAQTLVKRTILACK